MPTLLYFAACLICMYLGYSGQSPWWITLVAMPAIFKAYGHRSLVDELREARNTYVAFRQTRVLINAYGRSLIDCSVYFVLGFAWADLMAKVNG
jgi:hypothetical protein